MEWFRQLKQSRSLFFTTYWIYGAGFLVLLGMILQERALTMLGLLTLVTAGGSWLWSRYSLDSVVYTRTLSADRLFAGERLTMQTTLVNRKLLPLAWIEIEDELADRLRLIDRESVPSGVPGIATLRITTAMRWYERATWSTEVECPARGYFQIGPVTLRSGDLFGFFNRRETLPIDNWVVVYPRVADLSHIGIPARHLFGTQRIRRRIITDPSRTIGVRDYRPEDSFRHIHWKATARQQALQTKIFEPTTEVQFGIFLNLDTFEHYWEGLDFELAEGAIITAASIAQHASDQQFAVGMYANGVVGGSDQALRVRPGRSLGQMQEILEGLAKLSPIASINFPAIMRAETRRFPIGSTIVVVTAILTDPMTALINELARDGHQLVVLTVGELDVPALRKVIVETVPIELLRPFIPRHHHYAVRMRSAPVPTVLRAGD
jgi:uncharacterized protein (DUF58 family)